MMQSIKLLSTDFEPLGQTEQYVSMMFTKSWHGVGEFDFVIHREASGADQIKKGTMLALAKNKVGIVRHREIQLDQNGKITENWLFKGSTLKGIAKQRITIPPAHTAYDTITADAETVMKHYVYNHLVNPADPARAIPNLIIAENRNRGSHVNWQSRFKNVAEELEEISLATDIGWDITLDTANNQFIFDVFEGKDLSVNQTENSPVYFSPEFGNVKQQSFSDSDLNMRNVGYIAGQGEGVERIVVEIGQESGINRYETFVDARDIGGEDEDGNEYTEEEEKQLLIERGEQRMKEMENQMFFEAEIMSPVSKITYEEHYKTMVSHAQPVYDRQKKTELVAPFRYEHDFNLGDIVTIMNRDWGFIVDRRITECTEVHEANGFRLDAVFGQKRPDLISKMQTKFSEYDHELKR
jgi:hypothetical protein